MDSIVRTGIFAKAALNAFGRGNGNMLSRKAAGPVEQYPVRTKKTAIWPGDKNTDYEQQSPENKHPESSVETPDTYKRIVTAYHKIGTGSGI